MSSYATPGFTWSLPEEKKDSSPVSRKPLVNPLLNRKPPTPSASDAPNFRSPFTPVQNGGVRQRRKPPTPLTGSARKLVPPPKRSLLMGDAGTGRQEDTSVTPQTHTDMRPHYLYSPSPLPKLTTGDALERWVLVYGFSSEAQVQLVVRRFHNFGTIVAQRKAANWVAFQYDNLIHAEKARCQPYFFLTDGVLIGITRLTTSLQESLDWHATSSSLVLSSDRAAVPRMSYSEPTDDEVLLLTNGSPSKNASGKRNACEMILSWVFGW